MVLLYNGRFLHTNPILVSNELSVDAKDGMEITAKYNLIHTTQFYALHSFCHGQNAWWVSNVWTEYFCTHNGLA